MSEKYPLTEKKVPLRKQTFARWQYTLSGWIRLIRTPATEVGKEMESQIQSRMWEDKKFDERIRKEFEDWQAEEPEPNFAMDQWNRRRLKRKRGRPRKKPKSL